MLCGPLMTNGAPYTRTMSNLKYNAFTETGNISYCRYMLLHSPIGLGDHRTVRTERDAYHAMQRQLDDGCLHAWYDHRVIPLYPTLTEHMFPFTPIELHEGWVIGQERIITNRSGYFGWGDQSDFDVYVYDRDGKAVNDYQTSRVIRNNKSYAQVRLPEGYSAAIVRK